MALDFEHISFFLHSVVGVSHNCDQHVEEGDLGEEGRGYEDSVADDCIEISFESIHVEFAEHQHVLVQRGVNQKFTEDWRDDDTFFVEEGIQLQHVHGTSKVNQEDEKDYTECFHVGQRLRNQCNVERRAVEGFKQLEDGPESMTQKDKDAYSPS